MPESGDCSEDYESPDFGILTLITLIKEVMF